MQNTDFFLTSSEGYELGSLRSCTVVGKLRSESRDEYLLVDVEPPLIGQEFGLGGEDLHQVVLASRHQGVSLSPVEEWPAFVHVARLLVPYEGQERIGQGHLELIAWGEIYATKAGAMAKEMSEAVS